MKNPAGKFWITAFLCPILFAQALNADEYSVDAGTYVLKKFESHDIVLLGTRHQQPRILKFISELIPKLASVGISHICLEIPSDQQDKINHYMQTGEGLSKIQLWAPIDCQEYRSILETIREHPAVSPWAIDLPASRFKDDISRDKYMAQRIFGLYRDNPGKKILVVVGNLHVLKKLEWEKEAGSKHQAVIEYLKEDCPGVRVFSIGQVIGYDPDTCDFTKEFTPKAGNVALDCTREYSEWKLGILDAVAIKPTGAHEVFDGLIVY